MQSKSAKAENEKAFQRFIEKCTLKSKFDTNTFNMNPAIDIIIRAGVVYLFMIIAIRITGKKEISQLSVIDLVLILLISNAVQNAMVGPDSSLLGGIIAASTLFALNRVIKLIMYRFPAAGKVIQGEPVMLIYKGNINEKNLEKEHITLDELQAVIREHGVQKTEEVDLAILELNGSISVISKEFTHHTFHHHRKAIHPKMDRN